MIAHRQKQIVTLGLFSMLLVCIGGTSIWAANISEFVNVRPFAEIGAGYDDNIFQLPEDITLEHDDERTREDSYLDARAGVEMDIDFERQFLNLNLGLNYEYVYKKYSDNTQLDNGENHFDFDFSVGSEYEQGFFRDRATLNVGNVLALIPIDQEKPLLVGNQTWRNDFLIGLDYNLLSKPRSAFILGYDYSRTDYGDDPLAVWTVSDDYDSTSDLTQNSQSHTGTADFKHALNSKLSAVLAYSYDYTTRDHKEGVLESADFSRQNVTAGVVSKLSPRIEGRIDLGYTTTSYEEVNGISQDDQNDWVGEASLTGNFNNRPLMTVGYRRYFVENDFGDTLLTDDFFGRFGFKIAQDFLVNFIADYILETRALYNDDSQQLVFGIDTEYELVKNLRLLAAYNYRRKTFFEYDFLLVDDREETTNTISGGLEYQATRYFLLRGMYYYTDKGSDIPEDTYSRNQFVASGRVIF